MKTLRNKTPKPLRVPLPRGKVLHLVPGKTGQVADDAVEHPPLAKLIAAGDLEVTGGGKHVEAGTSGTGGSAMHGSTQGHHPAQGPQRRGDRGG